MGAEGSVRSAQVGELTLPMTRWRCCGARCSSSDWRARYWRFLTRVTLGLIRVDYAERQRTVVLLRRPLRLLRFKAPEYAMDAQRGTVRWRIEDGLLVQRRGHNGDGYLQIDVQRLPRRRRSRARGAHPRRGHGRELLPVDRARPQPARLPHHAVAHPRARDVRLPALACAARPRRVARWALHARTDVDDVPDPPLPPTA